MPDDCNEWEFFFSGKRMFWMIFVMLGAGVPASAVGNPHSWIQGNDYPSAALRNDIEGVVYIRYSIQRDGSVSDCEVTYTSGSQLLDDATCPVFSRRAKFRPARDDHGNPIVSSGIERISWQMPEKDQTDVIKLGNCTLNTGLSRTDILDVCDNNLKVFDILKKR